MNRVKIDRKATLITSIKEVTSCHFGFYYSSTDVASKTAVYELWVNAQNGPRSSSVCLCVKGKTQDLENCDF